MLTNTKTNNSKFTVNQRIRAKCTDYYSLDAYDELRILREIYRDVMNEVDACTTGRERYVKRAMLNEIRVLAFNIKLDQEFIVLVGLYQRAKLMEDIQLLESTWEDITRIRPLRERSAFVYEEL